MHADWNHLDWYHGHTDMMGRSPSSCAVTFYVLQASYPLNTDLYNSSPNFNGKIEIKVKMLINERALILKRN